MHKHHNVHFLLIHIKLNLALKSILIRINWMGVQSFIQKILCVSLEIYDIVRLGLLMGWLLIYKLYGNFLTG